MRPQPNTALAPLQHLGGNWGKLIKWILNIFWDDQLIFSFIVLIWRIRKPNFNFKGKHHLVITYAFICNLCVSHKHIHVYLCIHIYINYIYKTYICMYFIYIYIYMTEFNLFRFVCNAGNRTQGLGYTRQTLYHWVTSLVPLRQDLSKLPKLILNTEHFGSASQVVVIFKYAQPYLVCEGHQCVLFTFLIMLLSGFRIRIVLMNCEVFLSPIFSEIVYISFILLIY